MNEKQHTPKTILVVDDTPDNVDLLFEVLDSRGYKAQTAVNGPQALAIIQKDPPDLILLDIMMSGMDGYEVCRQVKADEHTQEIPIIFLSALDGTLDKVKAFSVGGVDFITKPFQIQEVVARIETHLTIRQTEEILQQRNNELLLLNRIGQMFSSSLELNDVLNTILEEVQGLLNVFSISCWLVVPETNELVCLHAKGSGSEDIVNWRLPIGQGITGWVAQHGETQLVSDTWADTRHFKSVDKQTGIPIRAMLSLPLKVRGEVIGVLNLTDSQVGRFTQNDLILLEPIAASAAIAIENARLYMTAQQEISERKQAEAALRLAHNELQEKNAQLRELNASKDKFFSIISHDLRSPLTAVLGYSEVLGRCLTQNRYQNEIKNLVEKVHSSAKSLYALLENLLTWSRIQRGVMEYEPEPIDLEELAEDNVALFMSQAEQKSITLKHSISSETYAYADYHMVNAILRNLVSNAMKFTPSGGTITISAQAQNEAHIEVAVSDTGMGIKEEDLAKLFRIDAHYTNVGTAGEKGTGLGLSLCKDLVEKNNGEIWVESKLGKGTIFRFTLQKIKQ